MTDANGQVLPDMGPYGDVSTAPHPHSDSSAKLCELRQCGASRTTRAILACMRSNCNHHRDPQTPISDFHFVLLLPSSLFLLAAPVIDTGDTQPPTPALDRAEQLLDAAGAVWQRRAITDQLTPAPPVQLIIVVVQKNPPLTSIHAELLLSCWSYFEGREQCRIGGAHEMWRLASASRRNASGADLGVLETRTIFLWRAGGRHEGVHWVHMCAAAHWRDSMVTT
ncbi:hypothetical protein B0H14DRAFT_2617683 [Mycena olivaceomarginata]|nr:hypothetical protein B0H14DRAFT_2617683 [Mycena olivaceomarginata]